MAVLGIPKHVLDSIKASSESYQEEPVDSVTAMYLSSLSSPSSPHFAQSPFRDLEVTPTASSFPRSESPPLVQSQSESSSSSDLYASSSLQSPTFGNNFKKPFTINRSTSSSKGIHKRNLSNTARLWISSRPSLDHTNMSGIRMSMDAGELEHIANLKIEDSPLTSAVTPSSLNSEGKGNRASFRNVLGSPMSPSPKRPSSGFPPTPIERRNSNIITALTRPGSHVGIPTNSNRRHSRQMSKVLATPPPPRRAVGLDAQAALGRIANGGLQGLMIIDVRPVGSYLDEGRLKGSLNANFPTLLLKRYRRGHHSTFSLESFITTDAGKMTYKSCLRDAKSLSDIDVLVIDDQISELEVRGNSSLNPACVLLNVLEKLATAEPITGTGELYFLAGSFAELRRLDQDQSRGFFVSNEENEDASPRSSSPLLSNRTMGRPTLASLMLNQTTDVVSSETAANTPATVELVTPLTPRATILNTTRRPKQLELRLDTSVGGHKQRTPQSSLPLKTPLAPKTPKIPPTPLKLLTTNYVHSSNTIKPLPTSDISVDPLRPPVSPRPGKDGEPPSPGPSTNPDVTFSVSTIIPGFLFLGPEPTCVADMDVLKRLGIKRILNMALECPILPIEWRELAGIKEYKRIGMKDYVEEVGVQSRMDEACQIMDDAQLRDEAVYVHCKAGRSRSVTMVLAFLIHRNHWSLKKAYAHVSERRHGISPNIGFVSELMKFEERTIVSTRQTIASVATTYHERNPDLKPPQRYPFNAFYSAPSARVRDSMPPPASVTAKLQGWRGEIRRTDGAWAVEATDVGDEIQPRRASKAGLESTF